MKLDILTLYQVPVSLKAHTPNDLMITLAGYIYTYHYVLMCVSGFRYSRAIVDFIQGEQTNVDKHGFNEKITKRLLGNNKLNKYLLTKILQHEKRVNWGFSSKIDRKLRVYRIRT